MSEVSPALESFLVCDDIRVEYLGKITLLGWYPAGGITVHKSSAVKGEWEPALQSLAVIFVLRAGVGSHRARFTLETPSGKEIAEQNVEMRLNPSGTSTVICKGGPIKLPEMGAYRARLKGGPWEFVGEVKIDRGGVVPNPYQRPEGEQPPSS